MAHLHVKQQRKEEAKGKETVLLPILAKRYFKFRNIFSFRECKLYVKSHKIIRKNMRITQVIIQSCYVLCLKFARKFLNKALPNGRGGGSAHRSTKILTKVHVIPYRYMYNLGP